MIIYLYVKKNLNVLFYDIINNIKIFTFQGGSTHHARKIFLLLVWLETREQGKNLYHKDFSCLIWRLTIQLYILCNVSSLPFLWKLNSFPHSSCGFVKSSLTLSCPSKNFAMDSGVLISLDLYKCKENIRFYVVTYQLIIISTIH
jgi:hypothetical protein